MKEEIKDIKIKLPVKILGWLICIAFLAASSITIVKGTKDAFQSNRDWTEDIIISELNNAAYSMYYRAMQEQNQDIDYVESCFFDKEVYTQDIFEALSWEGMLEHYNNQLDYNNDLAYIVFDQKNKELYSNYSSNYQLLSEYTNILNDPKDSATRSWNQKMKQTFGYYSIIQYDEEGNPTILDCFGRSKTEIANATRAINQSIAYEVPIYEKVDSKIVDMIKQAGEDDFQLNGEDCVSNGTSTDDNGNYYYDYYNREKDEYFQELAYRVKGYVNPSNIKNVTIMVAIEEPLDIEPYYNDFYMDYRYYTIPDGFILVFLTLLILVAIAAIIIACIKPIGIATGIVSKIPLEVIVVAVTGIILLAEPFAWLTRYHSKGLLVQGLGNLNLTGAIAHFIDFVIIYGGWFAYFAVVFFSIISVLSIFRKGIKRYFFENIITIRVAAWLIHLCKRSIGRIFAIDYHKPVNKLVLRIVVINFLVIAVMCCIWFYGIPVLILYSILVFYFLRKYLSKLKSQYDHVLEATHNMAQGQLDCQLEEELGVFTPMATELNKVQDGFKSAVSEEVKSQKMKTELITNVSHDLKTPLTAIITYINLLKEEDTTAEQQKEYIEVLDNKAMRLKQLIEDLFEVSKINSSNITLDPVDVDVVELIKQAQLELSDRFEEAGIEYRLTVPEEKVILHLDSQKTYRIFENLFVNVVKYAQPGTRAYMSVTVDEKEVTMVLKNISAQELNISPEQLTERFVRGDESRNTEGSGLGLAIVKSIVEVQGGRFNIEVDGDLFKAVIQFHQS